MKRFLGFQVAGIAMAVCMTSNISGIERYDINDVIREIEFRKGTKYVFERESFSITFTHRAYTFSAELDRPFFYDVFEFRRMKKNEGFEYLTAETNRKITLIGPGRNTEMHDADLDGKVEKLVDHRVRKNKDGAFEVKTRTKERPKDMSLLPEKDDTDPHDKEVLRFHNADVVLGHFDRTYRLKKIDALHKKYYVRENK